jgi:glucokinase
VNILAGDIGGTKTWLQIARVSRVDASVEDLSAHNNLELLFEQRFVSAQYESFETLLQEFLLAAEQAGVAPPEQACIGVAGPVEKDEQGNRSAQVTNLPWMLNAQQLAARYHLRHFHLINDFEAIAYGLEVLGSDELVVLQAGSVNKTHAPKLVIGAGTGLGQALLLWLGDEGSGHYAVLPSEAGHGDFAPASDEQRELVSFLAARQSRVSVEDVLSGRGLVNSYTFFANKYPEQVSESLQQEMQAGDAAAVVSTAGVSAADGLARRALDLFVSIYGAQAGNAALTCMAVGGVYIAGGIVAKIQNHFSAELFLPAFQNKGPMGKLMQDIPVKLVLDPQVGLKGAALMAARL